MIAWKVGNRIRFSKKYILLFCLIIAFISNNNLVAQTTHQLPPNQPEQDACNALQICGSQFFTPYSYTGTGTHLDLNETPCFPSNGGGEKNSVWLRINVLQAGNILFKLTPVNPSDNYNFAVLDITGKDCSALTLKDVIRCNYNSNIPASAGGATGLSDTSRTPYVQSGAFGESFAQAVFAQTGGAYLIMVSSASDVPAMGFTIDFSGSDAVFYNPPNPILKSVDVPCNNASSISIKTSNDILCSSIAADGSDFATNAPAKIISASGLNCAGKEGYTNSIVINFSSVLPPGNYSLIAKKGTDNNTLADICNNQLFLPASSIPFIVKQSGKVTFDNESVCYQQLPYTWNGIKVKVGGNNAASYTTGSAAGCDSTTILNLQVSQAPQQVYMSKTICDGDSYVLPWDSAVNVAGTYVHHIPNSNGCDSIIKSVTVSVIVPPSGTVQQRDSTIQTGFCLGGFALLSPGNNFTNYLWNTGQTSSSIVVDIAGTYSLMATDNYGCTTIDTFVVARYPFPVAGFQNIEKLCKDSSVTLDAGAGGSYYLWNTGSTNQKITANEPGTYWVFIATSDKCTSTDTVNVITVPGPARFLPPDFTKCPNKEITVTPLNNFSAYTWNNGSNSNSITVLKGGLYWLDVIDYNGCRGRDSIIVIDSICPSYFYMPNAFTPNDDRLNDIFRPLFSGNISGYHLSIFNRWGKLIFASNDPLHGWDGTVKGYLQPLDTYIWICTYSLDGNPLQTDKGVVTLIRQ